MNNLDGGHVEMVKDSGFLRGGASNRAISDPDCKGFRICWRERGWTLAELLYRQRLMLLR
jgi:hypothetical protein